jgi:multidrug efflux pump subunit AcrB
VGPIAWMARNPIAANLLMLLLLGGGFWTASRIQKEVYPAFELDTVDVQVTYPGAAPSEVETGILMPVEAAVRGVRGIREIRSMAREGWGRVTVELVAGADRMVAFQDIDQAVNRIRTFPDDIDQPRVRMQVRMREVMEVGLHGEVDPWVLRQLAERLRDRLLSDPAITQVELGRAPDYVTHVEISQHRLREYGLTLGQVARTIGRSSEDIPAGDVQAESGEILLRLNERKQWAEEFGGITIRNSDSGSALRLADIATITDGFEERAFHSQFNGHPSMTVDVYRMGEQSPLDIAEAVHRIMASFEPSLPEGVHVRIGSSAADDYRDRLSLLLGNAALAVVIVLAILAAFLELRVAFWVMMGMTVSFVGGLVLLPFVGVSINMISMFGFLVVLGIVVDDAIVVGENVHEHRREGEDPLQSAIAGTREIAPPVVFTILTNIVAFVPLFFIPGPTGKYWWPLPAVVIAVLLVSLVEALFILPAHLAHGASRGRSRAERWLNQRQQVISRHLDQFIHRYYSPLLRLSLRYRYVTLSAALGLLLVVGAFGYSGHMGLIMMPQVAADEIECGVRLPVGTTPRQAARVAREITASTQRMFEEHDLDRVAEGIKTNVRGGNFIDVEIVMKPPDERDMTANEVIELWREQIGDIEGVRQLSF